MDKHTAITDIRNRILERFPAGPDRQRWLAWLDEISHAEEILQALSARFSSPDEEEPHCTH
jgi:hypothetical protein